MRDGRLTQPDSSSVNHDLLLYNVLLANRSDLFLKSEKDPKREEYAGLQVVPVEHELRRYRERSANRLNLRDPALAHVLQAFGLSGEFPSRLSCIWFKKIEANPPFKVLALVDRATWAKK